MGRPRKYNRSKIVEDYNSGVSIKEIMTKHGARSSDTIYKILQSAGIISNRVKKITKESFSPAFLSDWEKGVPNKILYQRHGLSIKQLRRYVTNKVLPRRLSTVPKLHPLYPIRISDELRFELENEAKISGLPLTTYIRKLLENRKGLPNA